MALTAGTRLGPYEVLAPLGAGGMGEVYRARDPRLGREVAVKVLSAAIAGDDERLARFEQEARAAAALNHPNILAVYDIGQYKGAPYVVSELLEGETLRDRLLGGAMPPRKAVGYALQAAHGLSAAHEKGIVHRDLKPENMFLTTDGRLKILDFGLAKLTQPEPSPSTVSALPTTPVNTLAGVVLGTIGYMAPEQVRGLPVDHRSDIFALGAVLYEMLSGRRAFAGETAIDSMTAILKEDPPDLGPTAHHTFAELQRVVDRCLQKAPALRFQTASDLAFALEGLLSPSGPSAALVGDGRRGGVVHNARLAWAIAAITAAASIAIAFAALRRENPVARAAVQFAVPPPENAMFGGPNAGGTGTATQLAVSPDGRQIAFVAATESEGKPATYRLWLRPLASQTATPIAGTEGGTFPFWSPDSRFIGFFAGGKLKKIPIDGGPPVVLCDAPAGRGGTWSRENVIVFAPTAGGGTRLMRVSSAGGVPAPVTTTAAGPAETNHRWPHFLPDGRHFIYTATVGPCCPPATPSVVTIGSLDAAEQPTTLFQVESSVSYASRHVFFARDRALMAQPFDPDTRALQGEPVPLAEYVGPEGSRYVGVSVSPAGTLVYAQDGSQGAQQLTWVDRSGRTLETIGEVAYSTGLADGRRVALSPDGKRVAVATGTDNQDIWIIDLSRGVRSRLTVEPGPDRAPVWSPDGTRIAFATQRSGRNSLRQKIVNSTAADEVLLDGGSSLVPTDWSSDGRFLVDSVGGSFPRRADIWILPLVGDRKPFPIVNTAAVESSAVISPDTRCLAYTSDEAGGPNVYLQPFPTGGTRVQVSRGGGIQAMWRADGKELFYIRPDGMMMAAQVVVPPVCDTGAAQPLFPAISPSALNLVTTQYAVDRAGQRFLLHARPRQSSAPTLTVVLHWPGLVKP